jgi:outer membrane protein OmpA-like peptidoglycan-associated protein
LQTFASPNVAAVARPPRPLAFQFGQLDVGQFGPDQADAMDGGTRERVLHALQRQFGNAAVQALLARDGEGALAGSPTTASASGTTATASVDSGTTATPSVDSGTTATASVASRAMARRRPDSAAVAQRISGARGRGRSIEPAVRGGLESSTGLDLSAVRVHDDTESDSLATTLNAPAFTSGTDIFFSRGSYAPSTASGMRTLSHEVAHVVQQSRGPVGGRDFGGGLRVSERGDPAEHAAEHVAQRMGVGRRSVARAPPARAPPGRFTLGPGSLAATKPVHVQRCGPVACNCPAEKKQAVAEQLAAAGSGGLESADQDAERPPVQRLATRSSSTVEVQRAPQPLVPLGDFDLMFNPSSSINFLAPGATSPQQRAVNDANSSATYADIPRGSSGTVKLDVAMQWFSKQGPGPKPASCDLCQLLADSLTITIPVPIPGIPNIKIKPPSSLIAECQKRMRVDVQGVRDLLDDIADAALDPCGKLLDLLGIGFPINLICSGVGFLPGVGGVILAIQQRVGSAIRVVRNALKACQNQRPQPDGPAPAASGPLAGSARSVLTANFTSQSNGQLSFSGLPPQVSVNGTGARLVLPVDFLNAPMPNGGQSAQQPTMLTTTGAAGAQSRQFTVNIAMQPAPADAAYDCSASFGPFKVGKATFENDDAKVREIRDFYFGLHPKVREDLEEGRGLLRVTGRASKTGSQQSNLTLGEKRADRVRGIMQNFAGSDARLRVFSLGELGAQTLGCPDTPQQPAKGAICEDPNERRADVQATGTVLEAGELESKCGGHLGQGTPSGASQPVTEAEGPENVGLADAATRPLVRLFSRGGDVADLQRLLNEVAGTDPNPDGIFGQKTHSAVVGFQKSQGLGADGIVGKKTWGVLLAMRG